MVRQQWFNFFPKFFIITYIFRTQVSMTFSSTFSQKSNTRVFLFNIRGGSRAAATSKMECFVIIVNGWKPLTIITKRSILDVAAVLYPPLKVNRKHVGDYCGFQSILKLGKRFCTFHNIFLVCDFE